MCLQISRFLKLLPAKVAGVPLYIIVVHISAVLFQMTSLLEPLLAQFEGVPMYIDVVHDSTVPLQRAC